MAAWDNWAKKFIRLLHLLEAKGEYSGTAVPDTILTDLQNVQADIQDEATDLNTQAGALNTQATNLNGEATQLGSDYADLTTQKGTLDTYIGTYGDNEGILAGISSALGTIITSMTTTKTDIDTIKTALDGIKTTLDTIKTNLDTIEGTDLQAIIDDYGNKPTDQDVCDVMDKVHTDLLAKINLTRADAHGRCIGLGWYYKSQDTGNAADATVKKLCPGCQATGYLLTGTSDTPTISFPTTDEYSEELDQS